MLCVCVRDVMDVVFYVCIVGRGAMQMFYVCDFVHPVAVLNDVFCMTCSLLMLVRMQGATIWKRQIGSACKKNVNWALIAGFGR